MATKRSATELTEHHSIAEPQGTLPIEDLIRNQCEGLGLRPTDLVRRCGYQNISKGLRRLEELRVGNFVRASGLVRMLPAALEVSSDVVDRAIEQTKRCVRECAEAAWRASFRPHAIIITDRTRPEPLFVAAVIGVERLLRVDLDMTASTVTFVEQALGALNDRL